MIKRFIASLVFLLLLLSACNSKNLKGNDDNKGDYEMIELTNVFAGREISFTDPRLEDFLSLSSEDDVAAFLKQYQKIQFENSVPQKIQWAKGQKPYTVYISKSADFEEIFIEKKTDENFVELSINDYFLDGSYYYKVKDFRGNETTVDFFKTTCSIQTLDFKNVYNVRDLGGWRTIDSKRVKYGVIFRGGAMEKMYNADKELFKRLGIVTDLDLRGVLASESWLKDILISPSGVEKYYRVPVNTYDDLIKWQVTQDELYKQVFDILSREENYPLYIHCTWGADRTGTLAFLLLGLLGVPYQDICKDFELTSFYGGASGSRWRSNIIKVEDKYRFDESGIMQSDVRFGSMARQFLANYGEGTENLSLAIKNYLLRIGITELQIEKIRSMLIE